MLFWLVDVATNFYNFTINLYNSYQFTLLKLEIKQSINDYVKEYQRKMDSNYVALEKLLNQHVRKHKQLILMVSTLNTVTKQLVLACSLNCVLTMAVVSFFIYYVLFLKTF